MNDFELDRIRESIDIVRFVTRYVPKLRKSGAQYVGLCPFHREKTPSFTVHPSKKLFHCHGCAFGGDVFTFTMRIERLTFPEAKARLAAECGLVLDSEHRDWARIARDRELATYWRDGLIEIARELRNSFFAAYHRSRRHLRDCRSPSGGCCALALEVAQFYEERYRALDEKIDVLVNADMSVIVDQWRQRHGVAA